MASLKKRGDTYYIVFTRRVDGKLLQKAFSLSTNRKKTADQLKGRYADQYALGEIDPFGDWSPRGEREQGCPEKPVGTTLTEMSERFLGSRSHVRVVTRDEYRRHLDKLSVDIGCTMPVQLISEQDIRAYCFKPDCSKATHTTYLRFCRMFFKWLHDNHYTEENVCERIKYPKKSYNISSKIISEPQLQQIFRTFKGVQRRKILRREKRGLHVWFKPMIATFFYAGLRSKEARQLTWDNVDFEEGELTITNTKSGTERAVPIRKNLKPYLLAWYRYCGSPQDGLVFCKDARSKRAQALTKDNVSKVFKEYTRASGVPKQATVHGLRHSCATELLRGGLDINDVAEWLGHTSLEITRIYAHLNVSDLKRKVRQHGL